MEGPSGFDDILNQLDNNSFDSPPQPTENTVKSIKTKRVRKKPKVSEVIDLDL